MARGNNRRKAKDRTDNQPPQGPHATETRAAFDEWMEKHQSLREKPPSDGKDYLRHAQTLVQLLEPIKGLNSILGAVITLFKSAVDFEARRRENKTRVAAIFIAQTDLMRMFLEIEKQIGHDVFIDMEQWMKDILGRTYNIIIECNNTIDTYYKANRLTRLLKTSDLEKALLDHAQQIQAIRDRITMLNTVSFSHALNDMRQDMKKLLGSLNQQKEKWEDPARKAIRDREADDSDGVEWQDDLEFIRYVVKITEDPSLDANMAGELLPSSIDQTSVGSRNRTTILLEDIRIQIISSFNTLCEANIELFKQKLKLHTQQILRANEESTQRVLRAIYGPYDRVENEDMRELWKEMKWIFCIENNVFTVSLFEYFIDKYAPFLSRPGSADAQEIDQPQEPVSVENAPLRLEEAKQKLQKAVTGVETWAFSVLMQNTERLAKAIDTDASGLIRISEVNTFTRQMPEGWSLLQWCAYTAIGWKHERLLYKLRVRELLLSINAMQATVMDINRQEVLSQILSFVRFFFPLTAGFHEDIAIHVPSELDKLVRQKMVSQEAETSAKLEMFNFYMDGDHLIQVMFGDKPVEDYIFQLSTLLLGRWLQIFDLAEDYTIDAREWMSMERTLQSLKTLVTQRIGDIKAQYKKQTNADFTLDKFYGGIFSVYNRMFIDPTATEGVTSPEAHMDFYRDAMLFFSSDGSVDDFPLCPGGLDPDVGMLQFPPWEDWLDQNGIEPPESGPPAAWGTSDAFPIDPVWGPKVPISFPRQTQTCNACGEVEPDGPLYYCSDCTDVHVYFCHYCYRNPELKFAEHEPWHAVIKMTLTMPEPLGLWVRELVDHILFEIRDYTSSSWVEEAYECYRCDTQLGPDDPVRVCVGHVFCLGDGPEGLLLCESCAEKEPDDEDDDHATWHTLLILSDTRPWKKGEMRRGRRDTEAQAGESDDDEYDSDDDEKEGRRKLSERIQKVKAQVVESNTGTRSEIQAVKEELGEVKEELGKVKGELCEVKGMLALFMQRMGIEAED